jgi:rubrerythrin
MPYGNLRTGTTLWNEKNENSSFKEKILMEKIKMINEQAKIMEALKNAIDMETDSKECYARAGEKSGNEVGRKLLRSLALEEEDHRRKFRQIYSSIRKSQGWPAIALSPEKGKKLRSLFTETCELVGVNVKALAGEMDVISEALAKEKESYDYYVRQSQLATYDTERDFYRAIAAAEREHQLVLTDYQEYMTDPADYFTVKEHHSIDGG